MTYAVKIQSFMTIEFFVFQLEAFQFSKFHENVAKLDKGNFKRGLTVTFKVKNSQNYWKKWLKILWLILWVIKETVYKFSKI